jgi:hypothetical protein
MMGVARCVSTRYTATAQCRRYAGRWLGRKEFTEKKETASCSSGKKVGKGAEGLDGNTLLAEMEMETGSRLEAV